MFLRPHLLPSEKARANGLTLPKVVAEVEKKLLARADATVAVSLAEERACRVLGGDSVTRIANGVSDAFFRLPLSRRPEKNDPVRLGSIGRICAQKGTDVLLDALEILISRGIDAYLDVVGPSYNEDEFETDIRKRVLGSDLSGRVRLIGPVSHEELPKVVSKWDIYLQPSRYESQGIALLEAMAAGRCAVVTSLPAVTEFLNNNIARLLPTPPNGGAIAEAIIEALECPAWETRVRSARGVAKTFRWPVATGKLRDCLTSAIAKADWRDPNKTSELQHVFDQQAKETAENIAKENPTAGILLLGSAARGSARPGSDVDLLILQDKGKQLEQDWRFTERAPVDLRWETAAYVHRLCELSDKDFADEAASRPLVDFLCRARQLTPLRKDLVDAIALLQSRRSSNEIKSIIADQLLMQAKNEFIRAGSFARSDLAADAQLRINSGAQLVLQVALVRVGWMRHGAKRRLETAASYAVRSKSVRRAAQFLTSAVGVDRVSTAHANKLITVRTLLRTEHLNCLARLGINSTEVEIARRHTQGVTDYYSPAIDNGYLKGCINHLKSLSGVPLMPDQYTRLLKLDSASPANSFLSSSEISDQVRSLWSTIIEPHELRTLTQYAVAGSELVQKELHGTSA